MKITIIPVIAGVAVMNNKVVCWFSCGAASAVATKLFLENNKNIDVDIINIPIANEHPDNERFLNDCQNWFGKQIKKIASTEYTDIYDVFRKRKYINGIYGASCTMFLKGKIYNEQSENYNSELIGFTVEEVSRADKLTKLKGSRYFYPLIEYGLTKSDCLGELAKADIAIPVMYKLGFHNNNCIGCVKGGAGYWNAIRKHFPKQFDIMAKIEVETKGYNGGIKLNGKRVLLRDLKPNAGRKQKIMPITCSILCSLNSE